MDLFCPYLYFKEKIHIHSHSKMAKVTVQKILQEVFQGTVLFLGVWHTQRPCMVAVMLGRQEQMKLDLKLVYSILNIVDIFL